MHIVLLECCVFYTYSYCHCIRHVFLQEMYMCVCILVGGTICSVMTQPRYVDMGSCTLSVRSVGPHCCYLFALINISVFPCHIYTENITHVHVCFDIIVII